MKTALQTFQKRIITGYEHRIDAIEVHFDDEKMKQQLLCFFILWLLENTDPDKVTVNSMEELIQYAKQLHYDGENYPLAKSQNSVYMSDFIIQEITMKGN